MLLPDRIRDAGVDLTVDEPEGTVTFGTSHALAGGTTETVLKTLTRVAKRLTRVIQRMPRINKKKSVIKRLAL